MDHLCPRRAECPQMPGTDTWRNDQTCSFCGSLDPDVFMARLEEGTVQLGATDKSYKVYVKNDGGEAFKQSYRGCPPGSNCKGPDACEHWVTRDTERTKFYFQHLSEPQRQRFVDLLNEQKVKMSGGIRFYVLPFFIQRDKTS